MPETMKRAAAKKAIRDAIIALLETEREEDGRLEDIHRIIEGERLRGPYDTPLIAIVREGESITQQRLHYSADYELGILAIVTNDDPEEGMDQAEWFANEATAIIIASRDLSLRYVNNIRLQRSIPVSAPETERRKVASLDVIAVTYTITPI